MCCSIDMFRLLILRKMKPRPAADGLGPGPRSGRAAGDGGADFVGGGVERSAAETAAKLGEPAILDAASSPPDAGTVSGVDRKGVGEGKRVAGRLDIGGRRTKKKK